ncbi:Chanoclavine-I aldehyde reductase fgaOx3 [Colletotrichum trifolii]|uniref:Chanoclavine-I aldehyde reductase fgaOx3 n=1 Tax=Colletotrichum trifolii TaxID=5466 RepID=A0A4R8PVX7_COLTR|nr:Chanoclavine-I aldehyde reductase fgaOx3 [Colletotrichum trifolii]
MSTKLFEPLRVGQAQLSHRVVMAPLTRFRFAADHVPLDMALEYYTQRASVPGTLIIAEAVLISEAHGGFPNAPGIWNDAQIAGWKTITDAVHAKGSSIFCQLIAPGRAAVVPVLDKEGGHPLLSASAIPIDESSPVPREMTPAEIAQAVADFAQAGRNAMAAGFDGVEVHGANGYLVDQFLQDASNRRADEWGGSVANRARFPLAVAAALAEAVGGGDRVGFRVSPWSSFQGMRMADPVPQFSHLARGLRDLRLAYLHVVESRVNNWQDVQKVEGIEFLLDIWDNASPVLVAGGFTPELARRAVDDEYARWDVAVVFGRHFLANPDLPFRIKHGLPLNKYDRDTFYTPSIPEGYIDYPFHPEFERHVSGVRR